MHRGLWGSVQETDSAGDKCVQMGSVEPQEWANYPELQAREKREGLGQNQGQQNKYLRSASF